MSIKNCIVIGATGGIGQAFVKHLRQNYHVSELSRSENGFDLTNEETIAQAAQSFEDRTIDLIVVTTGYLGTQPEKTIRDLSYDKMIEQFNINTIGPALILKYFSPKMVRDNKSIIAILSARVGSISDNQLGGWYSYRASKAALNMIIKTTAIEMTRLNPNSVIVGLHPGTVDTRLSKPFQSNVPNAKLFTPDYSAMKMIEVISNLSATDSGYLFDYNGEKISF